MVLDHVQFSQRKFPNEVVVFTTIPMNASHTINGVDDLCSTYTQIYRPATTVCCYQVSINAQIPIWWRL